MRYTVATDGSTESDDAVAYAARHALAVDAVLEVVHVLTPETELVDGEVVMSGERAAIERGERVLDRASERAHEVAADRDGDLTVETQLLTGWPAGAVVDHAEATGADAIYVGHRGLSAEREQGVGSVAKTVVDKAEVPVTVIR
mgnify:FL=1